MPFALLASGLAAGQEPQSRPASRASAEPTAAVWQEWMEGLTPKQNVDVFAEAEYAVGAAGFTAARMIDCGARPFDIKGEKPSLLRRVPYVVAGFDPKLTYVEVSNTSPPVRVPYGKGFGARGVESLDVTGLGEMCLGDAKSQKADGGDEVDVDPELMQKILEALLKGGSEPIRIDATKLTTKAAWDPRNRVLLTAVRNNSATPAAVPRFARGLKARGAKAVLLMDNEGADATSSPAAVMRRDRYRRPITEDPPALFLTVAAGKTIGHAAGVPVGVLLDSSEEPQRIADKVSDVASATG
jgi:hypothetical protein